jgi:hypothetical protein
MSARINDKRGKEVLRRISVPRCNPCGGDNAQRAFRMRTAMTVGDGRVPRLTCCPIQARAIIFSRFVFHAFLFAGGLVVVSLIWPNNYLLSTAILLLAVSAFVPPNT